MVEVKLLKILMAIVSNIRFYSRIYIKLLTQQ